MASPLHKVLDRVDEIYQLLHKIRISTNKALRSDVLPPLDAAIYSAVHYCGGVCSLGDISRMLSDRGMETDVEDIRQHTYNLYRKGLLERPSHNRYRIAQG
jgi:hypothetical protein